MGRSRYPARVLDWDAVGLGTDFDAVLARRLGCSREWVRCQRVARGIPAYCRGAPAGAAHPRARFTAAQVRQIRRLHAAGWTTVEIAALVSEPPSRRGSALQQGRPCAPRTIGKITRGERY